MQNLKVAKCVLYIKSFKLTFQTLCTQLTSIDMEYNHMAIKLYPFFTGFLSFFCNILILCTKSKSPKDIAFTPSSWLACATLAEIHHPMTSIPMTSMICHHDQHGMSPWPASRWPAWYVTMTSIPMTSMVCHHDQHPHDQHGMSPWPASPWPASPWPASPWPACMLCHHRQL